MDCASLVLVITFLYLCLTAVRQLKSRLPPGPFPLPIIGNIFIIGAKPHISLTKLAKLYGPLMTLKVGSVTVAIASSPEMAKEILQKQDQAFSGRIIVDAARACKHNEYSMSWLSASNTWRDIRKFSTTHFFSTRSLEFSQDIRRQKIDELLAYVKQRSEKKAAVTISHAALSSAINMISNTVFSVDLATLDSDCPQEFETLARRLVEESGQPNIADFFPVLRLIDPQGIRGVTERNLGNMYEFFGRRMKERLVSRELSVSSPVSKDFLDALLDSKQEDGFTFTDSHVKALLSDIFTAGTETTAIVVEWAMTELLRNPYAMAKAKLELREKLHKDKSVAESDIPGLPYVQAIVKETFRLHPPGPFLSHKAEYNVDIAGFTVPKDTQVFVNTWSIGRDPNIWENPTSFMPDRFLNSSVDFTGHDMELLPFGSGRRICPGLPLAHRMVHLMLASLLHSFDWKLEEGVKPEDIDMEENFGLTLRKAIPLKAIPVKL